MTIFDNPKDNIDSVSKFLGHNSSKFYTSDHAPGKWMFRGHSNFAYKLIPSIGRLFRHEPFLSEDKLSKFEKSAFSEFKISSFHELRITDDFILLAVAQHHGLKTRLLDWTFSALVALFFAVEEEELHSVDGAFIAFQTELSFNYHAQKSKSPFDNMEEEYDFIFAPSLSPRIKAQQGIFQLFKDPTKEFSEAYNLCKFRIPAGSKKQIKRELEVLGITYKTVFPDLEGLCKTINYNKLKNRPVK